MHKWITVIFSIVIVVLCLVFGLTRYTDSNYNKCCKNAAENQEALDKCKLNLDKSILIDYSDPILWEVISSAIALYSLFRIN